MATLVKYAFLATVLILTLCPPIHGRRPRLSSSNTNESLQNCGKTTLSERCAQRQALRFVHCNGIRKYYCDFGYCRNNDGFCVQDPYSPICVHDDYEECRECGEEDRCRYPPICRSGAPYNSFCKQGYCRTESNYCVPVVMMRSH